MLEYAAIPVVRWQWADVDLRVPVVEKAKKLLGYHAKIDLEEGIRRTAAFYCEKVAT